MRLDSEKGLEFLERLLECGRGHSGLDLLDSILHFLLLQHAPGKVQCRGNEERGNGCHGGCGDSLDDIFWTRIFPVFPRPVRFVTSRLVHNVPEV